MTRGILWVSSQIENRDALTPEKFCEWYEDTHVQEVLALPGFPSASRWQIVVPGSSSTDAQSTRPPWLTVFEMRDIAYKDSPAFQAVHNQVPPLELIQQVYAHVGFDIRFYEEVSCVEKPGVGSEPGQLLVSHEYGDESVAGEKMEGTKGWARTRRYKLVSGVVIKCLQREQTEMPGYLAVHEFEDVAEKDGGEKLAWYGVRRVYPESEWGSVGIQQTQA